MGGAESVTVRIINGSSKTILYRFLEEKTYLVMKKTTTKAQIGAGGAKIGGERTETKVYTNTQIEPGTSRLEPQGFTDVTLELKGSSVAYVTIQPEGEKPI